MTHGGPPLIQLMGNDRQDFIRRVAPSLLQGMLSSAAFYKHLMEDQKLKHGLFEVNAVKYAIQYAEELYSQLNQKFNESSSKK